MELPSRPREVYAGQINNKGSQYNRHRNELRLDRPVGVVASSTNVIISLKTKRELIAINKQTDQGSRLASTPLEARFLLLSSDENTLYVTMRNALGKLELDGGNIEEIAGSANYGSGAGELSATEFNIPGDLVLLDDANVLVADQENGRYHNYTSLMIRFVYFGSASMTKGPSTRISTTRLSFGKTVGFCHSPVNFCAHAPTCVHALTHSRTMPHI